MKPQHRASPPMTLGNMREMGVRGLNVLCLNCRHEVWLDVIAIPMTRPYQHSTHAWLAPGAA